MNLQPTELDEVRNVLAAAADVVFPDGVSPQFLDHWAVETCGEMDRRRRPGRRRRSGPGRLQLVRSEDRAARSGIPSRVR